MKRCILTFGVTTISVAKLAAAPQYQSPEVQNAPPKSFKTTLRTDLNGDGRVETVEVDAARSYSLRVRDTRGKVLWRGMQMRAVVPIKGKLSLTHGAIFSFYEWKQPIANLLTDEEWQAMLRQGTNPPPPPWTKSFVSGTKPKPRQPTSSQYQDHTNG